MSAYDDMKHELCSAPKQWLVTGVAGFIGSNLLEELLQLDQQVVGLDNFSTGKPENMEEVKRLVTRQQWQNFHFIQGDIRNFATCRLTSRASQQSPNQSRKEGALLYPRSKTTNRRQAIPHERIRQQPPDDP